MEPFKSISAYNVSKELAASTFRAKDEELGSSEMLVPALHTTQSSVSLILGAAETLNLTKS